MRAASEGRQTFGFRGYGLYFLGVLAAVNFFNYATRVHIFGPVRDDLKSLYGLSSSDLGLLSFSFMAVHALATVPMGWLADKFERRSLICFFVIVWSGASLLAFSVPSHAAVLAAMILAGFATAACVPVVNALICENFSFAQKARAVSIFNIGLFTGSAAGFAIGFFVGAPTSFGLLAVCSVPVALLVFRLRLVGERVATERAGASTSGLSLRGFVRDIVSVLRVKALRTTALGAICMAFAAGGLLQVAYDFVSVHIQLSPTGWAVMAIACSVTGIAGILAGGAIGDRLQRRMRYGRLATISLGFALAAPLCALAFSVRTPAPFIVTVVCASFFIMWYHAPVAAVVDDLAPLGRASTAQAVFTFLMHLLGTAPAFYVVGAAVDNWGLARGVYVPVAAMVMAALILIGACRQMPSEYAINQES